MAQHLGHFWSAHEIRSFLESLIQNNFGPVLFVVSARRNKHAFVRASEDLCLLGYQRSSRQCHSKFKILRQQFNLAILNFREDPPLDHQSPYWCEMRQLWHQPSQPNPVNAFLPGAGPAQDIGLRHLATVRIVLGTHANLIVREQQQEGEGEGEGEQEEEGEQPG
ncbi:hypothetical protein JRQ81_012243 [Phrynocephalus forsythii]|uniref:Myb/SANT-like DNA-binding domain-containing protein n=1 Tax=Phrynocephalus forsythii TaxID=171643 RepID=A0A9Q0Y2W3_9SAUR|nr:hypothetical protein JRQ81_012243 [Phrynocephalus forsythii]